MLNIKDKEAHELARKLAAETGENMTRAVIVALRERLAAVRRRRQAKATAEELLAIGRRIAKNIRRKPISHDRLLYDRRGMPK
jgi:antitoxin VapB